jgi:hypothetical protein
MDRPPASKRTIVLTLVILATAIGWWAPNVQDWHGCGKGFTASVARGLFSKPSVLECAATESP